MKILITGVAGFIGSNLADRLIKDSYEVIGVDNFNDYYDPKIKEKNIEKAKNSKFFKLYRVDILDFEKLKEIFKKEKPEIMVHLGARAGVRQSIENPFLYGEVNKVGTVNLLKLCVDFKVKKFIFGSSSSVYGLSKNIPFSEDDKCEFIISPYGASKRSAEIFTETFNRLYGLKSVILRFFTVYGPRGRPDMAPALFAKAVIEGRTINQFGDGKTFRDYTYIDDVVDGIRKSISTDLDFEIINLGNNNPISLSNFISQLENVIGRKAKIKKLPLQRGDVEKTWANIARAKKILGWQPKSNLSFGLKKYLSWLSEGIGKNTL